MDQASEHKLDRVHLYMPILTSHSTDPWLFSPKLGIHIHPHHNLPHHWAGGCSPSWAMTSEIPRSPSISLLAPDGQDLDGSDFYWPPTVCTTAFNPDIGVFTGEPVSLNFLPYLHCTPLAFALNAGALKTTCTLLFFLENSFCSSSFGSIVIIKSSHH